MKPHHPKLKPPPRPLFSCGFFVTAPNPSSAPPTPPRRPPTTTTTAATATAIGILLFSNTNSQSFTQWRFSHTPISTTNDFLENPSPEMTEIHRSPAAAQAPPPVVISDLAELFHVAELQFSSGIEEDRVKAIYMLQHSLVGPRAAVDGGEAVVCPPAVMRGVLGCLKDAAVARPATKVLLAVCLGEGGRHVAVEEERWGRKYYERWVVEALVDLDGGAVAERALAALELLCTVAEGAAELRAHALVGPMMVEVMRRMETTRGRENAIGILAVIFGGGTGGGDAVGFATTGGGGACGDAGDARQIVAQRGRRKGAQLLKVLQENQENERLDITQEVG
ncbi:hypothetical protein OSB04_013796 [Centaurea solstitialis]|uniref:ARM repeat superfamily protein n=1 Tax=Centaurea solstitialis TaxID=347529 RepID=A0AA38TWZ3_9ASTR|nr:hypothetical protein OSB04_013796 [Centaurea solstitialis]